MNASSISHIILATLVAITGCDTPEPAASDVAIDSSTGKPLLDLVEEGGSLALKDDSHDGQSGPLASGISSTTAVWDVTRRWYQISDEAGIAWEANSGLTWDQKYAAWVESMRAVEADNGSTTFQMTTPYKGISLPAPTLECAETAMFLRATFAAWHKLPFFMSAYHPSHGRIYFGHFGIIDRNGAKVPGYPRFAQSYDDHRGALADRDFAAEPEAWPVDANLAKRALTTMKDDENAFMGEGKYAGAYFDAVFLNKRVGHLLVRLLTNFGSMHLADSKRNMFNLKPEAIRAGDVMLQRWQRSGIGHTLVIKKVEAPADDASAWVIESVFGSMPRIQPKWYNTGLTTPYLTADSSGGVGENNDGEVYATLGGGLKRWRTPVSKNGRWYNIVPVKDRDFWVNSAHAEALAQRTAELKGMVGKLSPSEQLDALEQRIAIARDNLSRRPASCTNRTRREKAFAELYELNAQHFDKDREATDREYRTLEDYVFAELVYDEARTCCWNQTTEAMAEIVMQYNAAHVWDEETKTCNPPVVFKAREGDYDMFKTFAEEIGRGDEWVAWSADESCPHVAAGNVDDVEAETQWTPLCTIADSLIEEAAVTEPVVEEPAVEELPEEGAPCGEVTWEGQCHETTVVWCQNGQIAHYSCSATARECGFDEDRSYYWCLGDVF